MTVHAGAVRLVQAEESCVLHTYPDAAGVPTRGWGHTGPEVKYGQTITQAQADADLAHDLGGANSAVDGAIKLAMNANEEDAMTSLCFNIGAAGFRGSHVASFFNAGNKIAAAGAFAMWNKIHVNGQLTDCPDLTRRRAHEAALFLTPVPVQINTTDAPIPVATIPIALDASFAEPTRSVPVAPVPPTPVTSKTQAGAAVAAAGGTLTVVAQGLSDAQSQLQPVKDALDGLGLTFTTMIATYAGYGIGALILGGAGLAAYGRYSAWKRSGV